MASYFKGGGGFFFFNINKPYLEMFYKSKGNFYKIFF